VEKNGFKKKRGEGFSPPQKSPPFLPKGRNLKLNPKKNWGI